MKLASKRYQNFSPRKNKRKINPEDEECKGTRAIRTFNPIFNAALMHDDYENARRMKQFMKLYHIKRATHGTPVSKTPHRTRVNRVFSRGLDLSHEQLVDSTGYRSVDPKGPEELAWSPEMRYFRWDFDSIIWGTPLRKFELSQADNSVSKQMANESPRYALSIFL
jgi:hypothetical protein